MTATQEKYEIGGVCVRMTAEQAARWNSGDTTDADCDQIVVYAPGRVGCTSRLVDGAVVVDDGLPTVREITLRDALSDQELSDMMDGMAANRTN